MEITLRPEEEKDYRKVEELTREAFWNVYAPGCDEHLLVHKLRDAAQFIRALDFVALDGERIVGNIIYAQATISGTGGDHKLAAFGPVSVLPGYQGRGIGSQLIGHTAALAREMGYPGIVIYGDPDYYERFGFRPAKDFNVTDGEGRFPVAMQILELRSGAMCGIEGAYVEEAIYRMDPAELEEFEKGFPEKEKKEGTPSQRKFLGIVGKLH